MIRLAAAALVILAGLPAPGSAQEIEGTLFTGLAYPRYEERLAVRTGTPTIPGVNITVGLEPELRGDGGAVFGGSLAAQWGAFGLEGRLDTVGVGIEFSGARYDLLGVSFPFSGLTASLSAARGRFAADRISILSANARVRTPGFVSFIASAGLSYLPDISVSGSVPLKVEAPELPALGFDAALVLRASPGQSRHRFGVNGGAGLRVGGRVAFVAEARAFYFREYELRFASAGGPALLDDLLADADSVRFDPVFVNAQAGVAFRF